MTELYNLDTEVSITPYINVNLDQEVTRVVNKTLDGQYYVQIIGNPASYVTIDIYANDAAKVLIMQAEANVNLLRATSEKGVFQGRILDRSTWEKVGLTFFKTTIKLGVVPS